LQGERGGTSAASGAEFLSQLLFHSAAISASKLVPSTGYSYALRVNPSSGNLHPTEFHFVTRGLKDWPDGLYHYRPSSHMAEQRGRGKFLTAQPEASAMSSVSAPIVFMLTSIVWREAWKYQERGYRYCLHDVGHAWECLALAARALGCDITARGCFPDDQAAQAYRLHADEWPMLLMELSGGTIPLREEWRSEASDRVPGGPEWFGGEASSLSREQVVYPLIEQMHAATTLRNQDEQKPPRRPGPFTSADTGAGGKAFGKVVRTRRSALDFQGGSRGLSLTQFSTILACAHQRLSADFANQRFIQLYLYVHRIEGLEAGLYTQESEPNEGGRCKLKLIRPGDQRLAATHLSLRQEMAGNACVTFSLVGDLASATKAFGDRGYRYVHFEAGVIGQRLYLAAEALGIGGSGIGAFFDDQVNSYLGLNPMQQQVVYHFAIGHPIPDRRPVPS
jgi:SagB-type dehydrogenase family enzyme